LRALGIVELVETLGLRLGERIVEDILEACVQREGAVVFRHALDVAVIGLEEECLRLEKRGLLVQHVELCACARVKSLLCETEGFHALHDAGFLAVHGFAGLKEF
jgi:hypothetical protein